MAAEGLDPRIVRLRQDAKGKNIHSVITLCNECNTKGVTLPDEDVCGNCGSSDTIRYYDEKTIASMFYFSKV